MSYTTWFKGFSLAVRDFWEPIKTFLYLLIFMLVANQDVNPAELRRYYRIVLFVFLVSALVGFLQYVDFAGINNFVSPYYAPTQMRGLLVHKRVVGTTPNPNEFGALMIMAVSFALSGVLSFSRGYLSLLCLVTLPLHSLALVLTLSRSALIASLFATATVLIPFLRRHGFRREGAKRVLTLAVVACVIVLVLLQALPEKAWRRYGQLNNIAEARSWQMRLEKWRKDLGIWLKSPWLGWGPAKGEMSTLTDNEWLLLVRRYGVVGITVFLCLLGSLFLGFSHIRKVSPDPVAIALSTALQGTLVGYAIYMVPAAFYHSMQLMSVFSLFSGLAYSQYRQRKGSYGH